jgi:hypothetical protein
VVFQTLARFHGSWLKWRHISANEEETKDGIRTNDIQALNVSVLPWMLKGVVKKINRY